MLFFEFFRWLALITGYPFQLLLFKRKTYYEDKSVQSLKIRGGALIISNHYHFYDYMMNMFAVLPRKLHVVSSEMPYSTRIGSFGMRFFGGIQANRITKNMRFIDTAADVIRKGGLVQIYPEGRITDDGRLQSFKHSYIVIAHRANAPIIPIVTDGNYGFTKRAHILVGTPIRLSDYIASDRRTPTRDELNAVNEMIHGRVLAMRERLDELIALDKNKKKSKKDKQ